MKKFFANFTSLLSLALILCAFSLGGCRKEVEIEKIPPPGYWDRMSPAQKDYYESLNNNQKKILGSYTSVPEQWEAFQKKWRVYTKYNK